MWALSLGWTLTPDAGERCVARHTNDENGGKIDAMLPI